MKYFLPLLWIVVGTILLSFIGVKNHPKEDHRMVIVKHKPSLKLEFYSPLGGTNKLFEELNPKEQEEELLYREFIKRPDAQTADNIAIIFFQLGLYLIVLSLLKLIFFRRKHKFKIGQFLSFNTLGVAVAMGIYQVYWVKDINLWTVIMIQVLLNLVLIFPRLKKNA